MEHSLDPVVRPVHHADGVSRHRVSAQLRASSRRQLGYDRGGAVEASRSRARAARGPEVREQRGVGVAAREIAGPSRKRRQPARATGAARSPRHHACAARRCLTQPCRGSGQYERPGCAPREGAAPAPARRSPLPPQRSPRAQWRRARGSDTVSWQFSYCISTDLTQWNVHRLNPHPLGALLARGAPRPRRARGRRAPPSRPTACACGDGASAVATTGR